MPTDTTFYRDEVSLLTGIVVLLITLGAVRQLRRSRPALRLEAPLLAAFTLRVALAITLEVIPGFGRRLRGPDDASFVHDAHVLASGSIPGPEWLHHVVGDLHTALLSVQVKIFGDPGDLSLRIIQIAFVLLGMIALAAAVHDAAGARAGALAAWIVAAEPSNVFFSSIVQKEPLVLLGEGVVVLGCVGAWKSVDRRSSLLIAGGGVLALGARPYAGLILLAGAVCLVGASLIRDMPRRRTLTATTVAVVALAGVAAVVVTPVGRTQLEHLQKFQDKGAANSNLGLEPVDFSTPSGIALGVPRRIRDFLFRPYPWQVENTSQRLGAMPTVLAWALLALIVVGVFRRRGRIGPTTPLLLPAMFVAVGYALTTANSGTGFRHRTHLLFLLAGVAAAIWAEHRERVPPVVGQPRHDVPLTTKVSRA